MGAPAVIAPGEGEVIGDAPDRRVEILVDHDALHATWSRFGPRRDGASLHVHHEHTDLFYVLDGELTVRLGPEGDERAVPAGSLVVVPPLVVHGFRNGADAQLRYLNFHAPGKGFADYMRGLRDGRPVDFDQDDPPADGGRPATEALVVADDGEDEQLLCRLDGLAITRETVAAGSPVTERGAPEWLYVLEGSLDARARVLRLSIPDR